MDTDARKRARAKYRETTNAVKITLEIPHALRERWKAQAKAAGKTLTGYITDLINEDLEKHIESNDQESPF